MRDPEKWKYQERIGTRVTVETRQRLIKQSRAGLGAFFRIASDFEEAKQGEI